MSCSAMRGRDRAPAVPTLVPTPAVKKRWRVQLHDPPLHLTRPQSGEALLHLFDRLAAYRNRSDPPGLNVVDQFLEFMRIAD
jgi:hypothetical protein